MPTRVAGTRIGNVRIELEPPDVDFYEILRRTECHQPRVKSALQRNILLRYHLFHCKMEISDRERAEGADMFKRLIKTKNWRKRACRLIAVTSLLFLCNALAAPAYAAPRTYTLRVDYSRYGYSPTPYSFTLTESGDNTNVYSSNTVTVLGDMHLGH